MNAIARLTKKSANVQFPGMHLLELAKVVWNDIVKNGEDRVKRRTARNYATAARGVLSVFGEEGDEGGPPLALRPQQDRGHVLAGHGERGEGGVGGAREGGAGGA